MKEMFQTLWKALILDDDTFRRWRDHPNVFLNGLILIVVVSLIAGSIPFVVDLVERVSPFDFAQVRREMDEGMEVWRQFMPDDPEFQRQFNENWEWGLRMGERFAQLRPPLGNVFSGFFEALSSYLSSPLSSLGNWMLYAALVLLAAQLLGGKGTLPIWLGTSALYVIPTLLGILRPVQCVGGLLALIGFGWGLVIYIKALTVSAELDWGKAILAVFAPAVVLFLLLLAFVSTLVAWLALWF